MQTTISLTSAEDPAKDTSFMISPAAQEALGNLRAYLKTVREMKERVDVHEIECSAYNTVFVTASKPIALMLSAMGYELYRFAKFVKLAFDSPELNQLILTYTKENGDAAGIFVTRVEERGQPKSAVFNVSPAH
jgi:hypothetical protein